MTSFYFVAFSFTAFLPQTQIILFWEGECATVPPVSQAICNMPTTAQYRLVKVTVVTFRFIRARHF